MTEEQLFDVLFRSVSFEKVDATPSENQLRIMGRVRSRGNTARWLGVVEQLLVHAEAAPWNVDISKFYFMRGEKLLFGWRIILQAEGVSACYPHIARIVQSAAVQATQQVRQTSDEVPLHGNPNRNKLRNGKGAQPSLTAVVGPMAAAQHRAQQGG